MITERPPANPSIERYMRLVPDGDLIEICILQIEELSNLISVLSEQEAEYRYDLQKWSIKEVLGHIVDTEPGELSPYNWCKFYGAVVNIM